MAGNALVLCGAAGIPLYGPSGSSAHLRGVVRALVRRGYEVRVAVPRLHDDRGAVDDPVGDVRVITAEPRRWGLLPRSVRERGEAWDGRALLTRALADGWTPDLVWERYSLFCDAGKRLSEGRVPGARFRGRRVLEVNAPLSIERARYERVLNPTFAAGLERAILRSADRIAAVSRWLVRWSTEEVGCAPERARWVPNGVEDLGPGDRDATRARLGLDGLVLGFLGSMKPWHGVERIPWILKWLPRATALVVGDGPVELPEHPRIRAVGRVPPSEVRHYVAAMDVGLAPYDADAPSWFCPLKIYEYMAQGVPVVAADIGDAHAIIAGTDGRVVGTEFPETWAEVIGQVYRDTKDTPRVRRVRTWDTVVAEALDGL